MSAAEASVLKVNKGTAALRARVEAAEAARQSKRAALASEFSRVSAQ
jgi:hypothetical protein